MGIIIGKKSYFEEKITLAFLRFCLLVLYEVFKYFVFLKGEINIFILMKIRTLHLS